MVQRIVINATFGGFSLNDAIIQRLQELDHAGAISEPRTLWYGDGIRRDDPLLVQVIEELGDRAGRHLQIIDIPDGIEWAIMECDGFEWVVDKNRTWPPMFSVTS